VELPVVKSVSLSSSLQPKARNAVAMNMVSTCLARNRLFFMIFVFVGDLSVSITPDDQENSHSQAPLRRKPGIMRQGGRYAQITNALAPDLRT
jgi:hypothetical protein